MKRGPPWVAVSVTFIGNLSCLLEEARETWYPDSNPFSRRRAHQASKNVFVWMQPYYQTLLHHLLLTTYVFLVRPQLFVLRRSKPQSAVSSLTRPALIQSAVGFFINRLLLLLFKPSPVHSWGCSVSNLCGNQLLVNPGRLVAVTISRSVSKRGLKRMSSGQGCIHTCIHPAEVYQVTAAAPPHSPWAT